MNTQAQAATRKNGQHSESWNRNVRLRHAAAIAVVAAVAAVTTAVVIIGGSAPAHACLLPGIPC